MLAEGGFDRFHVSVLLDVSGNRVLMWASCMSPRGLRDAELIEVAQHSSMDELAKATAAAVKLLVL